MAPSSGVTISGPAGPRCVSLALLFQRTRIGRALRAVADDHQAAQSVGICRDVISPPGHMLVRPDQDQVARKQFRRFRS
ncbi:hypothetical protein B4Q13_15510 [Lacticaseibacillus rhamnosus]